MSKLSWYWHRLRAMSPGEVLQHARRKYRQRADLRRTTWPKLELESFGRFPRVPRKPAPDVVRETLRQDMEDIMAGRWRFFGGRSIHVDDPPRWQYDYIAQRDMTTASPAFHLDYRSLRDGVDSKAIWEPNRWHQIVRLAMAAFVLGYRRAGDKCLDWLEDWVQHNPPYRGWNWTSALEVGLRLIQFAWIDELLVASTGDVNALSGREPPNHRPWLTRLEKLRHAILPAHARYVWRYHSFGSSANNHLLGELAGLIVATTRWPQLSRCGGSLSSLADRWRREVLAQFAEDGGNREQALGYQLFSWELCWQALQALRAGEEKEPRFVRVDFGLSPIEERLVCAARFFGEIETPADPWDYGDSDNAFVVPFFSRWDQAMGEWHAWVREPSCSPALVYWLGDPPPGLRTDNDLSSSIARIRGDWRYFPESGMAVIESGFWRLRWDLSPLGYLETAAHGHLDALHVSIWRKGVALVVDPGTGFYHANSRVRTWLASREAHNGPAPVGLETPRRLGPFLWGDHHAKPRFELNGDLPVASLAIEGGLIRRSIRPVPEADGWEVGDSCDLPPRATKEFTVRWQFAPASWVKRHSDHKFSVHRADVAMMIEVDENWATIELLEPTVSADEAQRGGASLDSTGSLDGLVSPVFGTLLRAPCLKLTARPRGDKPCVFTTTFLASAHS